jgi:uncharacterized protein
MNLLGVVIKLSEKKLLTYSNHDSEFYAKCICKTDAKIKTIFVGFPGMGLAGSIAVQHIAEELDLKTVGFVQGAVIPPVAVFLDGVLRHPYRIMANEEKNIAIFVGESPVSSEGAFHIGKAIIQWAENHGAKEIICLDGFGYLRKEDEGKVYLVAEPEVEEKAKNLDIPPMKSGYIKGFAGAILNETMVSDIDGYALLVGTRPDLPDPGGAAEIIKVISKLKKLDIDIKTLKEQEDSIKRKLQELAAQTREMAQEQDTGTRKKSTFYT